MPTGEIQVFNFEDQAVRTVEGEDGEPRWVVADVCRALAYANAPQATGRIDDEDKGIYSVDTPGGRQNVLAVNESGLYALILGSRKPEAKRFKKWVTAVVLPSLRKTGRYDMAPADPKEAALISARNLVVALETSLEADRKAGEAKVIALRAEATADQAAAKAEAAMVALTGHADYVALSGYASMHRMRLSGEELKAAGKAISAACHQAGIPLKKVSDARWGEVNGYPVEVLDQWRARLNDEAESN